MSIVSSQSPEGIYLPGYVSIDAGVISLNSANTDFPVALALPQKALRWRFTGLHLYAADGDCTAATIGCYTAAAAGGAALITAGTAVAVNTATAGTSLSAQSIGNILNAFFVTATTNTIYIRVGTAAAGRSLRAALVVQTYP